MKSRQSFGLPEPVIQKIHAVFSKYDEVGRVILYGSRAKGTYRPSSDIDLCIEGPGLNLTQLLYIEHELDELLLPWKIDLSLKHKIDNQALLEHIRVHGILFFSRTEHIDKNRMNPT